MELLWSLSVLVESYVCKVKRKPLDVWKELLLLCQDVLLEENKQIMKKIDSERVLISYSQLQADWSII